MNDSGGGYGQQPPGPAPGVPLSADGRFWWDGQRWRRVAMRPSAPPCRSSPPRRRSGSSRHPRRRFRGTARWRRPPPASARGSLDTGGARSLLRRSGLAGPPVGPDGARPAGAASARPHRVAAAGRATPLTSPPTVGAPLNAPTAPLPSPGDWPIAPAAPAPSQPPVRASIPGAGRPCRPGHPPRHRSLHSPGLAIRVPSAPPVVPPGPRTRWHSSSRRRGRLPVSRPRPGRRPPRAGRPRPGSALGAPLQPPPSAPPEPRSSNPRSPGHPGPSPRSGARHCCAGC